MKMAAKRKQADQIVRCFEVSSPTLHEKGHTVYKITQRLIRVDKQEEDIQEVSVWRRYNDIKHLYKAMHKLHAALHRKDEFPPFAEAKLFGRFDEGVIIERMRSAQDLLNFVGQRHYMVNHEAFKHFFEGGELSKCHEAGEKLLRPQRVSKLSGDSDSDASLSPTHKQGTPLSPESSAQDVPHDSPLGPEQAASLPKDSSGELGGVWQYRQAGEDEDEESVSVDGEEEDNTDTDSVISTPLPTDTNQFDPLAEQSTSPSASAQPVSNLWLLSSLPEEEEMSQESQESQSIRFQVGSDGVEFGKGDLLVSPVPEAAAAAGAAGAAALPQNASPRRLTKPSSLLNLDLQDKGDYIVQAAKQISLAQHCEASNNYHLAFSYYKNGVGILLTGVQLDENETRREVVRRKTARYLIKAEEIHKRHLSQNLSSSTTDIHPNNRWDTGQLSPARELDPAIALLQGSFSELRNFKVLGILDSVMLVMDVNTENTFVIKVLRKSSMDSPGSSSSSSSSSSSTRRCLVRARGPHMVELYRFYDSPDAVFLLLEHAAGGRLWRYVAGFLHDHAAATAADAMHHLADVYDGEKRLRTGTRDSDGTPVMLEEREDISKAKADGVGKGEVDREDSIKADGEGKGEADQEDTVRAKAGGVGKGEGNLEKQLRAGTRVSDGMAEKREAGGVGKGKGNREDNMKAMDDGKGQGNREDNIKAKADGVGKWEGNREDNMKAMDDGKAAGKEGDREVTFKANDGVGKREGNRLDASESEANNGGVGKSVIQEDRDVTNGEKADTGDLTSGVIDKGDAETRDEEDRRHGAKEGDLDESNAMSQKQGSLENNVRGRLERFDSALDDGDVALDRSNTLTIDQHLQHVQFDATVEEESVVLDSSTTHSGTQLESLESRSIAEETESEGNSTFQSLLEHTRRQALVGFAVDSSFESEDPPSRQLSNTIDSIEEEPTQRHEESHLVDNVFIGASLEAAANTLHRLSENTEKEEEPSIYDNQPPYISDSDSEPVTLTHNGASPIHRHITESSNTGSSDLDDVQDSSHTAPVQSINSHSVNNSPQHITDGNALCTDNAIKSPMSQMTNSEASENTQHTDNADHSPSRETITTSESPSLNPETTAASVPSPRSIFRQVSRERSADSRRRHRSLSGAFAELDLAGEEDTKQPEQRLPEQCVRQWAAELVVAVDALHQAGIICRDLNPANLLLGERGHLLLSHFSVWSSVERGLVAADTEAGGYVAPELCGCRPPTPACDWWSVGALIWELLVGRSLASCHPAGLGTHTVLALPEHLSPEAASLLTQLLRVAPAERLQVLDIKTHAFFSSLQWQDLEKY